MSGFLKIPGDLLPYKHVGHEFSPAHLEKKLVIFFEGRSARIVSIQEATEFTDDKDGATPCAVWCGERKVRTVMGKLNLKAIRRTSFQQSALRGALSRKMSPRHPQSGGNFRTGAYYDLLDGFASGDTRSRQLFAARQTNQHNGGVSKEFQNATHQGAVLFLPTAGKVTSQGRTVTAEEIRDIALFEKLFRDDAEGWETLNENWQVMSRESVQNALAEVENDESKSA